MSDPTVTHLIVDEFIPDDTTEADEKRQWEVASMNRADRRRAEREGRRAAKRALIERIGRSL